LRRSLQWLLTVKRITYKSAFMPQTAGGPGCLASLIKDYQPTRSLRLTDELLLNRPSLSLAYDDKAFFYCALCIWNSLSWACRAATSIKWFF